MDRIDEFERTLVRQEEAEGTDHRAAAEAADHLHFGSACWQRLLSADVDHRDVVIQAHEPQSLSIGILMDDDAINLAKRFRDVRNTYLFSVDDWITGSMESDHDPR